MERSPRASALIDRLADADRLVEVGIGTRSAVAAGLLERGCSVTATDVVDRPVPDGVRFVRDDVTDPDPDVYADADVVYALRCPPELHGALARLGRTCDRPVRFTTLGADPPAVPVDPEQLPGTTLYRVRDGPGTDSPYGRRI